MAERDLLLGVESGVIKRLGKLSQKPLVREGMSLLGLYWLYSLVRWLVAYDSPYEAFSNAYKVFQAEKTTGNLL